MITSGIAFYPCADLGRTDAFYTNLIGLETAYQSPTSRIYSAGQGYFGFVAYPDGCTAQGRLCLSLNCRSNDEVDAEYGRIVAAGGNPTGAPALHPSHPVYSFFIPDPNGYLVEFQKIQGLDL